MNNNCQGNSEIMIHQMKSGPVLNGSLYNCYSQLNRQCVFLIKTYNWFQLIFIMSHSREDGLVFTGKALTFLIQKI